jgi:hypothetical protein
MASGRKTGGRTKGTPNKATAARQEEIAQSGVTPLEYMLSVMRDEQAPADRRDDMAKAAAPYVHPKLAAMDVNAKLSGSLTYRVVSGVPRAGD